MLPPPPIPSSAFFFLLLLLPATCRAAHATQHQPHIMSMHQGHLCFSNESCLVAWLTWLSRMSMSVATCLPATRFVAGTCYKPLQCNDRDTQDKSLCKWLPLSLGAILWCRCALS